MSKYLVDTSIIVDYLRQDETAAEFLSSLPSITISAVTAGEIYQGVKDKRELASVEEFLSQCAVLPITEEISALAIKLLRRYSLATGLLILDALIAATAITAKLTVVTANVKHFRMIKELSLTPWSFGKGLTT